ncbi:hypothetical protein BDB00DRAFT_380512 [Zychaea mexicana]|uniref:uncharacterized protein n=1 Tax=Zychaea mexicana TaxID=64656 RepID=UPI0022FECA6A|nr:uncharacterized protein BDB00DRAFT_380512 [Zychaea mexicana]KAI9493231.1 hypothetical protein BDB00DRAFT_380512 [Zychaea mexicana]
MRLLLLAILFATLLSLCACDAQFDKDTVDSTGGLHLHYAASPHSEQEQHEQHLQQQLQQQQKQHHSTSSSSLTLTLPPAVPPTVIEQVISQVLEWHARFVHYLEQRFPRYFELLAHVHRVTEQARHENQVFGRRYVLLTWDDIYFDLRRMVSWWPLFAEEASLVMTDTVTRRRAIADTIKHLRPRSLQQGALTKQIRLLHWTTDAAERSTAATHELADHYSKVLDQLTQFTDNLKNETIPSSDISEMNKLLLQTNTQGLALVKNMRRTIDAEFAKIVWLSGPLRPWLEELKAAGLSAMAEAHKDAMYTAVSRIRKLIINSITLGPQDLATAVEAVDESKPRAERAFSQAEKQLRAIWENAASEIRASPWTTPYWEDALKDTVMATQSHVLSFKSMIQSVFARLAGCHCGGRQQQ